MSHENDHEMPDFDSDEGADESASIPPADDPGEGGISEKQRRANQANAKKSTGPRTEAGKARSSKNSTKTGIFMSKIEPVTDGSLAEDPDEFYERVDLLVRSMNPRDPIEWEVATRIAGVLIKLERLDRWSAASIAGAAVMRPEDIEAGARSEAKVQVLLRSATQLDLYLSNPSLVADPDFEVMAMFIRYMGPESNLEIEGFWDDDNTPSDNEEWRRAFEALKDALWASDEKAASWAMAKHLELSRQFEQIENLEERIAANRILNGPFELQLRYEARLLNNLRVLRREYAALQERDLN